ncbi:ABC transporter substrate-binding protein/permease [Oribacterium sp. C9]|uniref:ABC transporter substrate-binding protein/permease n=1 Tax=Oribacterium sp. C9 TaxID=1943579 RepID=UPI001439ECC2|nr:ABC transporter substrate-binding protein/permease [Oribacterium sp. C9]
MKTTGRRHYPLLCLTMLILALCALIGCSSDERPEITSLSQLSEPGLRIGVILECPEEKSLPEDYPEAKIFLYNDPPLVYDDLKSGRLDAFVYSRRPMEIAIENGTEGVCILEEDYSSNKVAVGISPKSGIPDFKNKVNRFIAELKADGTLDDMYDRWVIKGDTKIPDIPVAENPSLHLTVATAGTLQPYTYFVGTELNGYDIELAKRFAAWMNAELEFKLYDFKSIVAAAQSGDVDCIMSNLFYTDERGEGIPYSDILFIERTAVMVRDPDAVTGGSGEIISGIYSSFHKTFIREDRWKLFLSGVETTLVITFFSILCGTLLGFYAFMLCRNGNPVANFVSGTMIWLVQGMPVVVLLMILYFVVFESIVISGVVVSIIGFTLVFGASVFQMVKSGVDAIDRGQMEAANALGYSDTFAFFRFILPQALPHFIPAYRSEVTATIKATAIVGYIAVQDLTKMGDIVRGRTYEAFFPLVSVAVIYFLLEALLKILVDRMVDPFDFRKRKPEEILKGINVKVSEKE